MKLALTNEIRSTKKLKQMASVRTVLLVLVSFSMGVAATALWFHRPGNSSSGNPISQIPEDSAVGRPGPPSQTPPPVTRPQPVDPAIIEEVKKSVPNYESISLDDGENILRAAALKDFAAAAKEMDDQVAAAQQRLQDTQSGQSANEQQTAMKHLQETQAAEAEKLKEVAMRLNAQIAALKSLKNQQ
jgi:hypothetical protein